MGEELVIKYTENQVGQNKTITNSRERKKLYRKSNPEKVQSSAANGISTVTI